MMKGVFLSINDETAQCVMSQAMFRLLMRSHWLQFQLIWTMRFIQAQIWILSPTSLSWLCPPPIVIILQVLSDLLSAHWFLLNTHKQVYWASPSWSHSPDHLVMTLVTSEWRLVRFWAELLYPDMRSSVSKPVPWWWHHQLEGMELQYLKSH